MSKPTVILGIESSCDETAAAVVVDGREVRSNVIATQIDAHARYGGVVPEIASRQHLEAVNTVLAEALDRAGATWDDLDAIAVTHQPGLVGALLVGLMAAKTVSMTRGLPLVGVNHVAAHAYAACLDDEPIAYPAVALIASGGHTSLYHCQSPTQMKRIGNTRDDAAGEAYDKVAKILGLGYPGGPVIDKAAQRGKADAVAFPRILLKGQSLDFSFSGMKTAVLYHINGIPNTEPKPGQIRGIENYTPEQIDDVAASFQQAVVETLCIKIRRAVKLTGARTIILGGGVAANTGLREGAAQLAHKLHCKFRRPPMAYCTDNAAMIAGLGYQL
ncbi:MAG: tRNA (adenosine(37)-N6)-threonylcarbamoyltransferase complex transferase subunit TsaD, partial [Phycisphaerales bacterium]|nr:tRNA (adenosine(37)-N6)-threonylcarbamoyltransferase complex transferase subunit TsaD [Phycisphaerales bacterium]